MGKIHSYGIYFRGGIDFFSTLLVMFSFLAVFGCSSVRELPGPLEAINKEEDGEVLQRFLNSDDSDESEKFPDDLILTEGPLKFSDELNQYIISIKNYYHLRSNLKGKIFLGPYELPVSLYCYELQMWSNYLAKDFYQHFLLYKKGGLSQKELQRIFSEDMKRRFSFHKVYGPHEGSQTQEGSVFMTGYFSPQIIGKSRPQGDYTTPLYRAPSDLYILRPQDLEDLYSSKTEAQKVLGRKGTFRLRISKQKSAEGHSLLVPYFSRHEIDSKKALKGMGLEIAYVRPVDSFFLQIQGSGSVIIDGRKKVLLNYASQNGHNYLSIGRLLKERNLLSNSLETNSTEDNDESGGPRITASQVFEVLENLPPKEQAEILEQNPSYVFFKETESASLTFMGASAVPGRSFASDKKIFPPGGLAFLEFPDFAEYLKIHPGPLPKKADFSKKYRILFDQDKGGAIRGGGRIDLFTGHGEAAFKEAGNYSDYGKMWYLIPRSIFIKGSPDR